MVGGLWGMGVGRVNGFVQGIAGDRSQIVTIYFLFPVQC